MLNLRSIAVVTLWSGALCLAACGGGGGSGASAGTAVVAGQVLLRDGTTQNLGGVQISLTGLGVSTTTASDGSFSFGRVPTGDLAVAVRDPLVPLAANVESSEGRDDEDHEEGEHEDGEHEEGEHEEGDDHGGRHDDDGDAHDVGDDDFDMDAVEDGDEVSITICVRDGKIESLHIGHHGADGHHEARVALARTIETDDADAEGSARLESRVDRQRLSIEAEHLDAGRSLEAFVILDGVEASIGAATVGATGEAHWRIATNDGGVLPHGATTVAELAGADVEVRDALAGTVLLKGTLPEVEAPGAAAGGSNAEVRSRGRSALVATAGNTGSGHVDVCRRVDGGLRNKIEFEVEHVAAGLAVDVFMESGVGSGVFAKIGSMTVGSLGEAELEFESHDGDAMPFGVLDVADLVGRAVEIRTTSGGIVILTGVVPALVSEQ